MSTQAGKIHSIRDYNNLSLVDPPPNIARLSPASTRRLNLMILCTKGNLCSA